MHRLGHWYTWTTLERPHGLHFFLDLREAEQRDIAKDIIKLACKTSMGAKAQAKQQGSTQVCVVGSVFCVWCCVCNSALAYLCSGESSVEKRAKPSQLQGRCQRGTY